MHWNKYLLRFLLMGFFMSIVGDSTLSLLSCVCLRAAHSSHHCSMESAGGREQKGEERPTMSEESQE